jgi:hypothetical protein
LLDGPEELSGCLPDSCCNRRKRWSFRATQVRLSLPVPGDRA